MVLVLRYYQKNAIADITAVFKEGHRGVVYCAPTASGKTVVAAELIRRWIAQGHRVLVVCHRREIMWQASATLNLLEIPHGLIAAGQRRDREHSVQIALVGSLPKRKDGLNPDLILFDEMHHIAAPTWRRVIEWFPNARRLGLSATPQRLDRLPLTPMFTTIVQSPSPAELRKGGYLADFIYFAPDLVDLRAALTEVKVKRDEYNQTELSKIMSGKIIVGDAVAHFRQLSGGRTALAFCVDVKASMAFVDQLIAAGISARHVDSQTPIAERESALAALAAGDIRVLSSCEIFTEGLDAPSVGMVVLLRPTRSVSLYLQMVGRAMRPGGPIVHILDHSCLVYSHDLPDREREWTLDGSPPKRRESPQLRKCPPCECVHELSLGDCPNCGHAYESPNARNGATVIDGTLVIIKETSYTTKKEPRLETPAPAGFMSIADCARRHDVSEQTVRKWTREGLPHVDCTPCSGFMGSCTKSRN